MQQWAKINKEMTKIEEHDERQKEKDKDGKIQIKRESSNRRADHGEQDKTNGYNKSRAEGNDKSKF